MIAAEYPDIEYSALEDIIKLGLHNMQQLVHADHDVRIWNAHPGREYHLALVRSTTTESVRGKRALKNFKRLTKLREKRKAQKQ